MVWRRVGSLFAHAPFAVLISSCTILRTRVGALSASYWGGKGWPEYSISHSRADAHSAGPGKPHSHCPSPLSVGLLLQAMNGKSHSPSKSSIFLFCSEIIWESLQLSFWSFPHLHFRPFRLSTIFTSTPKQYIHVSMTKPWQVKRLSHLVSLQRRISLTEERPEMRMSGNTTFLLLSTSYYRPQGRIKTDVVTFRTKGVRSRLN